jgi:hypothetical protein
MAMNTGHIWRVWIGLRIVDKQSAAEALRAVICDNDPNADFAAQLLSFERVRLGPAVNDPRFVACNTQMTQAMWQQAAQIFHEGNFPQIFWAKLDADDNTMRASNKAQLQALIGQQVFFQDALDLFGLVVCEEAE